MTRPPSKLGIDHLAVRFPAPGSGLDTVLEGIQLDVAAGELAVLLGTSGCGKSETSGAAIKSTPAFAAARERLRAAIFSGAE